jgi:hypothetical protein
MCQKAFKIKLFPNSELFENSETQETWQCIKNRKIDSQDKKCRKSVVKTVPFFQFLKGCRIKNTFLHAHLISFVEPPHKNGTVQKKRFKDY